MEDFTAQIALNCQFMSRLKFKNESFLTLSVVEQLLGGFLLYLNMPDFPGFLYTRFKIVVSDS